MGLPNIVTVLILYSGGLLPASLISFLRIILSGFMFGNVVSILYSCGGFVLSILVMALLKKTGLFSILMVSSFGGCLHNLGQLIVASFLVGKYVFTYLPFLIIAGIISGSVIGFVGGLLLERLEKLDLY